MYVLRKQSVCIVYFSYTITYYHIRSILWVTLWAKFISFTFHSVAPAYSNNEFDTWSFLMTILHQSSIREYPLNVRYYTIMN